MLQSGSAAKDLVLVLGVKELVDVGVAVEEGLGRGGQQRVLDGECSLDNPVHIAHNIVMALLWENIIIQQVSIYFLLKIYKLDLKTKMSYLNDLYKDMAEVPVQRWSCGTGYRRSCA